MFNMDNLKLYEPPFLDDLEETPWHPNAIIPIFTSPLYEDNIFENQTKKIRYYYLDSFLVGRKGQYSH